MFDTAKVGPGSLANQSNPAEQQFSAGVAASSSAFLMFPSPMGVTQQQPARTSVPMQLYEMMMHNSCPQFGTNSLSFLGCHDLNNSNSNELASQQNVCWNNDLTNVLLGGGVIPDNAPIPVGSALHDMLQRMTFEQQQQQFYPISMPQNQQQEQQQHQDLLMMNQLPTIEMRTEFSATAATASDINDDFADLFEPILFVEEKENEQDAWYGADLALGDWNTFEEQVTPPGTVTRCSGDTTGMDLFDRLVLVTDGCLAGGDPFDPVPLVESTM
jgi:hypothetical protein